MSQEKDILGEAGKHWDEQFEKLRTGTVTRVRWWEDDTTKRHINGILGHPNVTELHGAFHEEIAKRLARKSGLRAISVGCAAGTKEMSLMPMTGISKFDLFDISPANIQFGKEEAARQGILDRVNLRVGNALDLNIGDSYDLVYWNNALHHMPSVSDAIRWSRERLKPGGLLAMDDFVGPNRFQWTNENLSWATKVRQSLPNRFLRNPYAPEHQVPREIVRPTPEEVVAIDPSEAMDSERIVSSLLEAFSDCEIIPTGGALYHLALNDIFCNFQSEDDLVLLRQILMLDQALADHGTTQYAVAFATNT